MLACVEYLERNEAIPTSQDIVTNICAFQVWQYVTLMRKIYLIDCPGVVHPSGDTETEIILKGVVSTPYIILQLPRQSSISILGLFIWRKGYPSPKSPTLPGKFFNVNMDSILHYAANKHLVPRFYELSFLSPHIFKIP